MRRVVTVLLLAALPVALSLKCYVAYSSSHDYNAYDDADSEKKPATCDKAAKSCASSYKPSEDGSDSDDVTQFCSYTPCMLNGQDVNHAVCLNTTDGHEECCCSGDGCNENYRMQHFLDKGIPVKVPTACNGFETQSYLFGKIEYDKDPVGNFTDEDEYFDSFTNFVYPNGTVARVVCKEGHGTYNYDDYGSTNRVEKEMSARCLGGTWTDDLDYFTTGPRGESIDGLLVCEPDNADWKESFREDYFENEYVDDWSIGDADDEKDSAGNSTEPRLKCNQGYKVSPLLLRECKKGAKSCSSTEKVVDSAVCYNASAEWDERCCCYGDGCNANTLRGEFRDKGISVTSPTTCVGFNSIPNGRTVYSEKATGTVTFDEHSDDARSTYPNGTVARLSCDKGYAPYRTTNGGEVYEKYVPTFTCDNGGWVREGHHDDDLETLSIHDSCEEWGDVWRPDKPPKQSEAEEPQKKLSLADSVAQRIELFYDKAKHSEQVFLKRLFKHLATKMNS